MALIKFLTNLGFTALHTTETYMLLSPGVSAVIASNRARMLGTQEQVWPHLYHMALGAVSQLCDLGLPHSGPQGFLTCMMGLIAVVPLTGLL